MHLTLTFDFIRFYWVGGEVESVIFLAQNLTPAQKGGPGDKSFPPVAIYRLQSESNFVLFPSLFQISQMMVVVVVVLQPPDGTPRARCV